MTSSTTTNSIHEVFPYLIVRDARAAIAFYERAFGASEQFRLEEPGGRIGHVQLKFGGSVVMFSEEFPEKAILSPLAYGGSGSLLHLHVDDVDEMSNRAVECGAKLLLAPTNQFYGERTAKVVDPFGHTWLLGAQVEEVSTDEMQARYTAMGSKPS